MHAETHVVVRNRRPPVRLALDVSEDDVLDGGRHTRDLPWDIGLPASPRLGKMLQDSFGFVSLQISFGPKGPKGNFMKRKKI